MKFKISTWVIAMVFLTALAGPPWLASQEPNKEQLARYIVTDLHTLGGPTSVAFGVNQEGRINGDSTLAGGQTRAFLWRNGVMIDLGTLGGPNSDSAFPLNDRGEVAGLSETATLDPNGEDFCGFGTFLICLPFVWREGVMTPLPTLGGNNGQASEINNRGQIAGEAENTTKDATCAAPQVLQIRPVIFEDRDIQELPTLSDPDGFANAINDRGQVVGASGSCATPTIHAMLWQQRDGQFIATDLGNLGGTSNNVPQDINDQSQVVGFSNLPGDTTAHAFLWTKRQGMRDLGTLPGDVNSFAYGINSKGEIVGTSLDAQGNARAFVRQGGALTDLNTLIPAGSPLVLLDALSLNDRGDIVGDALEVSTGEVHAYLATPCDQQNADNPGSKAATGTVAPNQRTKVVVPANARRLLRQRLGHR